VAAWKFTEPVEIVLPALRERIAPA
jgi:hypothetical protein